MGNNFVTASSHYSFSTAVNNEFVYISGETGLTENIASEGAWQDTLGEIAGKNGFVAKFTYDGKRIWGTYYNGEGKSHNVKVLPYGDSDNFYITGMTESSSGMTTVDGLQPEQIIDDDNFWSTNMDKYNIYIAHFSPEADDEGEDEEEENAGLAEKINEDYNVLLFPNPAESYTQLKWNSDIGLKNPKYRIVDLSGRIMARAKITQTDHGVSTIDITKLANGIYFVNVYEQEELIVTKKLIVKK